MKKMIALIGCVLCAGGCDATSAISLATLALTPSTWTNLIAIINTITGAIQ